MVGRITLSELPPAIQTKLSIGLTAIDASGRPQPALAKSWDATDSGKTYIFEIDTSLKWQDGSSVTSRDIRYQFRDASTEYPDKDHLVIKLPDAYSPLPSVVSRPVFKASGDNAQASTRYIGIGTYSLRSIKRNGTYLDRVILEPTDPNTNLPRLQYQFYASGQQARTAFKLGLIHEIDSVQEIGELKDWPNVSINGTPLTDRYVAVFINTQDPLLTGAAGKNLRLALTYAIDKNRWPHRAVGPLPASSWAFNPDIKKYDQDMPHAKNLLSKVEKLPEKLVLSTVPAYLEMAELVRQDWQALGLNVEVVVSPDIPADFQTLLVAQAIPQDPDQYNLWHSTQEETNLTQLNNPRIDKLLEDGRKTLDIKERRQIYMDFQRFLLEEAPAIFLTHPVTYSITKK